MQIRKFVLTVSILSTLLFGFQNCQEIDFGLTKEVLNSEGFSSDTTVAYTEMNTSVEFTLIHSRPLSGVNLSFVGDGSQLNGQFSTLDAENFRIRYAPNFGFRGQDNVRIVASDSYGNAVDLYAIVNVGNALTDLQPALAIRGMGCVQCHANVSSNVITDFGYGSSYYFNANTGHWSDGGIYGDHGRNFNTMKIAVNKSVIVPKASLPYGVYASLGLTQAARIMDYLKVEFARSEFESTRNAKVEEKSSVYIGAPAEDDLVKSFHLAASDRFKYYRNSSVSPALSGLKDANTFFRNDGVLNCDGDLVVRGPLYLENLKVKTIQGCRLYVIGSVFLFGSLTYESADDKRNVQIVSTRSISLGLGTVKKNGAFCESGTRWEGEPGSPNYSNASSLMTRYRDIWTTAQNMLRQSSDPIAFGQSVINEAAVIEKSLGVFYDASCRPEGRHIAFERLLLNAPVVNSRYNGDFSGSVIAEHSIMALGQFTFSFDEVFRQVPVLPFVDHKLYLDVQN